MKTLFALSALLVSTSQALAHWGHVGELAGHGHALGIGLLAGAAALAAALAAERARRRKADDAEVDEAEDQDAVEAPA